MGFRNPPMPWRELVGTLDGTLPGKPGRGPRRDTSAAQAADQQEAGPSAPDQQVDESPEAAAVQGPRVPYAELHAHSTFSFLDGASGPPELVREARRLGLSGLALTDHDGFYGAVKFAEAAEGTGLPTMFGAELGLGTGLSAAPGADLGTARDADLDAGLSAALDAPPMAAIDPRTGIPDPDSEHLLLLARGPDGYHGLASAITSAQLRGGEKGRPAYDLDELAALRGRVVALTGCRKGAVRRGLAGPEAATALDRLVDLFGQDGVLVELTDHGDPLDDERNDLLAALAADRGLPTVATNNVHYARPADAQRAALVAAIRAVRSLDALDGWLPAHGSAHLRSGAEMLARFRRHPHAVSRTAEVARELAFPLQRVRPALPRQDVPPGHTPMSWLRHLVWSAVPERYPNLDDAGRARIEHELAVIEAKDFPGYFLIVHDIVAKAQEEGILCQGRGSAASSAVCFLLGITAVDAIDYELPFERFLSAIRDEEPDIDIDFDSSRREEIIQYVYEKYGRTRAAQVCNVIEYRPRGAIRDAARALGYTAAEGDAFAKAAEQHGSIREGVPGRPGDLGRAGDAMQPDAIPRQVVEAAAGLLGAPRHLGIHSGGMVLTQRPVGEVVPIEPARMDDRTVIQWDKDDAAWIGLVKFDLLGLGMLGAIRRTFDVIAAAGGERLTLATIPKEDPEVYDMLCRADAIGIFQVESRAQLGLLPRLRPRRFYDLAIQIALIRPGPIQGGAVHPFVRRKTGKETVTYAHELLRPVLERTLGVPVFQEQLMQMGMAVGGLDAADADLLRRAMGSKRGIERIESIRERLYAGMAANGLTGEPADAIYRQILAFADFGFAESHSLSFALLVYASAWLKLRHPAAFLAGLLDSQPMGFYSPATLVADARRHGVEVRRPCILASAADCALEGAAVRLGLAGVRGIGGSTAAAIVAERERGGPYASMRDLVRRTGLTQQQLEALATADAFAAFGLSRRQALWEAGSAARDRAEFLVPSVAVQPPLFGDQTAFERLAEDLRATGLSVDDHPIAHFRDGLDSRGVLSSSALRTAEPGRRVEIAGLVTHRQRPRTASGITFLNIEDEHGSINVICSRGAWARFRAAARNSPALVVRGMLERSPEGVTNVLADHFEPLSVGVPHASRDFR